MIPLLELAGAGSYHDRRQIVPFFMAFFMVGEQV